MRCITVGHTILAASGRWTPSFFFGAANVPLAAYEMIELRQLVSVSKKAIDPQTLGACQISYIGLENVRPETGELVDRDNRPIGTKADLLTTDVNWDRASEVGQRLLEVQIHQRLRWVFVLIK